MSEFRLFLAAVGKHLAAVITGGALGVLGVIYSLRGGGPIPPELFWVLAVLCLLWASFLPWRDEHREKPSLNYEAIKKITEAHAEIARLKALLPVPRRLTQAQRRALVNALQRIGTPTNNHARFGYFHTIQDGLQFGEDLAGAFSEAGWESSFGDSSMLPEDARGVHVSGSNAENRKKAITALEAVGIIAADRDAGSDGADTFPLEITIGAPE